MLPNKGAAAAGLGPHLEDTAEETEHLCKQGGKHLPQHQGMPFAGVRGWGELVWTLFSDLG